MRINSPFCFLSGYFHKSFHQVTTVQAWLRGLFLVFILAFPSGSSPAQTPPPPNEPSINKPVSDEAGMLAAEYTGCGGQYPGPINIDYEQQVVELVNAERTSRGLPPFKRAMPLDQAARYHAVDMGQDDYFHHDSYDRNNGNLVRVCAWSARIDSFYPNRSWLGENIAWGYATPQSVMAGWMGSSDHRSNILHTQFREIGVGYATGNIWVQDFGQRENVYPIVINNEAAETDSPNVNLYIHGDSTTLPEMRLRNDSLTWSNWMMFQNNLPWQLPDAIGTHTVSMELREGGSTSSSSDSIYLTTASNAVLGNLPETLTFIYSIAEERFAPEASTLTPLNIGNQASLTWQAIPAGDWFDLTPDAGVTPESFTITPQGTYTETNTLHTGTVTVTVTAPSGTAGSPQTISLTLAVFDGPFRRQYLPLLLAANP